MTPKLQDRVIAASRSFDQLERLRSLVENTDGSSPTAIVASAALLSAEVIATASGKEDNTPLIHRMYEEIIAAVSSSEAVSEAFSSVRTASVASQSRMAAMQQLLTRFRLDLAEGESHES